MPERLTLAQRQQKLLEERGFSKPQGGRSADFNARMDRHLQVTGRTNAVGSSRQKAQLLLDDGDASAADDSASVYSRFSHAPSLHPSVAGSVMSEACHSETIGAGDATAYWDYQHRGAERPDLGHNCKECRLPFTTIGEPLTERRGARISMRYHAACFSGYADPRSQVGSSHHVGRLSGTQLDAAPGTKAGGKMRTAQHFDSGGAKRTLQSGGGGGSGKTGMGLVMGSNGFGAKSSRGTGIADAADPSGLDLTPPAASAGPGLSEAQLRAHNDDQRGEVGVEGALGRLGVVGEGHDEQ